MTDGDNYYDQFRPKGDDNRPPEKVSTVVRIGVLAKFMLALLTLIRKKD